MIRALAASAAFLLLGSCQGPDIVVEAAFVGNRLAFVAADPGETGDGSCWNGALVVDDRLEPVWQTDSPADGTCRWVLPLIYGRAPPGDSTLVAARRLEPGRLYLFLGDTSWLVAAFALSRAGDRTIVHNVDPESIPASDLRVRYWRRHKAGHGAS